MKKTIFLLVAVFYTMLASGAKKETNPTANPLNANPINVAVLIIEKGDSTKIVDLFDYYGYSLHDTTAGYKVMKDSRGNEIKYTFDDPLSAGKYPKVIVKTNEKRKEIDKRLKDLQFKKDGDIYEHMINRDKKYITKCSFEKKNILVFHRNKY